MGFIGLEPNKALKRFLLKDQKMVQDKHFAKNVFERGFERRNGRKARVRREDQTFG